MLHHPDPAAIVLQQQQLHQQQQQQQQQQHHHHLRHQQHQHQQQQFGLVTSSKDFMAATANTSSSNPSSAIQEATGFVQERYTHSHHLQDSSLLPPSPLMLNPTIVPSQSSQHQQQLMSPAAVVAHQQQEMHPHVVHPYSHQLQHQHQLQQQQQQQQQTLQHHRSVFQLQQQYQQQVQQQLQQDQQDLDEATARGQPGSMEMGFQRKRSLSVPLLLSLNPGGGGGLENDGHMQDQGSQGGQSGQDLDGDQDMDTDELTSPSSLSLATGVSDNNTDNSCLSTSTALVYDYSKMTLQRESLLATLPRSHRHRAYAGNTIKGSQPGHSRHTLYYSGNHHPHASLRQQYNPFTNRKFPPYQYWAVSAQRDYHLSTIGVFSSPSGARSVLNPSSSTSGSGGSGESAEGGGGTGDLFLRAALGGSSGGGVNKSVYRSRLPVHLRHITSRNNRRPAICLTAFPGGEGRGEGDMDDGGDKKRHSMSVLPSSTVTARGSSSTATGQDSRDQGSPPPSTGSGSTSVSPLNFTDRDGSANHGGESSSSPTAAGRGSLSAANRKKLSDWKRVTALNFEREGDPQRTGMVMRLATNDSSSIMAPTTSLPGGSSSSSSSSSLRGNSSSGRQWLSQRSGLANLFQTNLSGAGGNNASGNNGGGAVGPSGNNVDRLVEEMTKWSV
ncbi:hypothetical protein BGZ47_002094 [Haplosporangium gracile]|nr:hypothetical protein BGZ47_002094 [Haplosporangium gracile]